MLSQKKWLTLSKDSVEVVEVKEVVVVDQRVRQVVDDKEVEVRRPYFSSLYLFLNDVCFKRNTLPRWPRVYLIMIVMENQRSRRSTRSPI